MTQKPKLIPVRVPWMVSSPPHFQTWKSGDGCLNAIAFIAFFKLETAKHPPEINSSTVAIVEAAPAFSPSGISEGAPYRLVRILFDGTIYSAMRDEGEFSDDDFDWSAMPIDRTQVNSVSEYVKLGNRYLIETSLSPTPRMYEVERSPLIDKLVVNPQEYKHIVLVGEDHFFDVVARAWKWEPGQAVD